MVSVCIATYNGEEFIEEQLKSILCQITDQDEVIISDDASTDNTVNIIMALNDTRIKLLQNEKSLGVVRNFERALGEASKSFIFLSDQDDVWKENKISICLNFLQQYHLVLSDFAIVNKNREIINPAFFSDRKFKLGFINNFIRNSFVGSCMAFRKEVLETILPFPCNIPMHDWWIGMVSSLKFSCFYINQPLVEHRLHHTNTSSTGNKSHYSFLRKINMRLLMLFNLLKFI